MLIARTRICISIHIKEKEENCFIDSLKLMPIFGAKICEKFQDLNFHFFRNHQNTISNKVAMYTSSA